MTVFDRDGKQIEHIDVPEKWTGNICFGGKDRQTLFITASKHIYGAEDAGARGGKPVIVQPGDAANERNRV